MALLQRKTVTARKPHHCTECKATILIGERYTAETYGSDAFRTYHICKKCMPLEAA